MKGSNDIPGCSFPRLQAWPTPLAELKLSALRSCVTNFDVMQSYSAAVQQCSDTVQCIVAVLYYSATMECYITVQQRNITVQ